MRQLQQSLLDLYLYSPQDSLTTAAEEPMSPEVVLMEESAGKVEPDADDAADQLLLHEDGETLLKIQRYKFSCWILICDLHGRGRSLVAVMQSVTSSHAVVHAASCLAARRLRV